MLFYQNILLVLNTVVPGLTDVICFMILGKMTAICVCVGKMAVVVLITQWGACGWKQNFVEHFCLRTDLETEAFVNQGITVCTFRKIRQ